MAAVTICIPAYRAAGFIAATLRSALGQTFQDIDVHVAIEPPGDEEVRACAEFTSDPRLRLTVNARRLGWAENIAAMLQQVRTPFFVILPHDDFLHPRYVEKLYAALIQRPDAAVAYGDIQFMYGVNPRRRSQTLIEQPLSERLLSFLIQGAEAPPWRGVTRTSALDGMGFPTDEFQGFLVECEHALHLLTRGVALRVPETLYFKRVFAGARNSFRDAQPGRAGDARSRAGRSPSAHARSNRIGAEPAANSATSSGAGGNARTPAIAIGPA